MALERRAIRLHIRADASDDLTVQDLAIFVYDINLLYELYVQRSIDPESVERGRATGWIFSRTGRRIPSDTRLLVGSVEFRSPLDLVAEIPTWIPTIGFAIAGLWGFVQTIEKLYNLSESHRLIEAQRRLTDAQAKLAERQFDPEDPEIARVGARDQERHWMGSRNVDPIPATERRLQRARLRIIEVDVEVPDDL